MLVIRKLEDLEPERPKLPRPVVTIGTFDGVHKGHQVILKRIQEIATEIEGSSILVTFHPHPKQVINPDARVAMLTTLDEKLKMLEAFGLDAVVVVPFTREFSEIDATSYVRDFLVGALHPHTLVIGYDHRFGRNREGSIELLKPEASALGVKVIEIPKQQIEAAAVSSTRIRQALAEGKVALARELSGSAFSLTGVIVKGDQIGRELGYPTANMLVEDPTKLIPATGVYAVRVLRSDTWHSGLLSIGYRPTFNGREQRIETHILDFSEEIYGERITIRFVDWIRGEERFESREALIEAMDRDKARGLEILSNLEE